MISSKVLGNTEAGKAWTLKALHPSEDVPGHFGIPDRCAAHTVSLNYVQRFVVPAQDTTAWSAGLTLFAHPLAPLAVNGYTTAGVGVYATLYNTQIPGYDSAVSDMLNNWIAMAQQWRVTYGSMTAELDASSLYNSGSIVAAIKPVEHRTLNQSLTRWYTVYVAPTSGASPATAGLNPTYNSQHSASFPVFGFQTSDMPSATTLSAIPGGYQGLAKDGIYMPLPIDKTDQQWMGEKDLMYFGSTGMPGFTQTWPAMDTSANDTTAATPVALPPLNSSLSVSADYATHGGCGWPYGENIQATFSGFDAVKPVHLITGSTTYTRAGNVWFPPSQASTCQAFFSNISPNAQIIVTVRMGFEIVVRPSTILSTQAVPSPLYDPLALDAYFAIRRAMAMAYPAAYNDLNKLLKTVLNGARAALPALAATFPALMPFVAPGEAILSGANALRSAIRRRQANNQSEDSMRNASNLIKK